MNSLFGVELPTAVTFVIAFIIVLGLIGAAAWAVRRFGAARLAAGRGRQPRLAVIDAASVDGRRKLIIIRRDNVEHLLMIGGPTDVVVETNILRAGAASQREPSAPRASETLPRAVPLPDAAGWPQPEPTIAPRPERPRAAPEESPPMPAPIPPAAPAPVTATFRAPIEPQLRVSPAPLQPPAGDPLAGLAAELSRARTDTSPRISEPPRIPEPPRLPDPARIPDSSRAPLATNQANGDRPTVPPPPLAATTQSPESHLAEMAQRLENALRRPLSTTGSPARQGSGETRRTEPKSGSLAEPRITGNGPTNGSHVPPDQSTYEDLEKEMASLLGRQSGKS